MKILFWTDGFWPRLGGIETQSLRWIESMQARGHEYMVLAQRDHPSWQEEETYAGITIRRFDFNAIIAKYELSILGSIQTYLEKVMREFQPDIVHLNATIGGSAFVFLLCINFFHVPIILTSYAPYTYENKLPSTVEKIASSVHRICCISNWVLQEMQTHLPLCRDKLRLIYCGLAMPDVTPSPLSFSPPVFLLFGRLSWEKGFATAVEAFSLLKKRGSNAQLIIAGGGPERPALENLVDERGLRDSVTFTGVLTQEEVLSTFNLATVVVVPSIIESFGLVILEAMQMGRPVIASDIQGIPEVLSDAETGLLVPMKDPVALAEAMQFLLDHPDKAIQMGMQGRKRAEKFTLSQSVAQYEDLYEELLHVGSLV